MNNRIWIQNKVSGEAKNNSFDDGKGMLDEREGMPEVGGQTSA